MAIDWTKLDKQDDDLKKRLKQFDRGAKTSGKAEATRSTPTADAAKTLLSSGVNPVAPLAPAAQSARTVTTLPVIQTLPTVADRRAAREDAAAQKNIAVPAAGLGGGSASARAGASRSSSAQAQSGFLDGLTVLPSSPQQFAKDFAYGAERAGAGLLNAAENVTDLIGSGFYKGLQGITSLGGAASNPVSEWAGRNADAFLDNSVSRDWEESIRERYQPTKGAENLTGIGQSVVQMLPGIGASKAVSALAGASNALNAAKALRTGEAAGRALFGLQAAGGGANEARAEGAGTGKALAYGAASGLLETTIEGIAGGIPGLGKGKIGEIAQAVKASPAVSKALDIAGEGGEEALSAILTPYLKRAIYDPDAENATAQEIAQSAILGAVAAGVLQAGIELPGAVSNAVSDIRSTRAAIGSNADIARRAGQRLSTPQTLPVRDNPLVTLLPDASKVMQNLPGSPFESAQAAQTQPGNTDPIQKTNAAPAGAVEAAGQNKTASTGETAKRMTMADFTNVDSPIWNNVGYEDTETQSSIMRTTHREMVKSGRVVRIPESTTDRVGQSFPDLRAMKKAERTPILRQKMNELKSALRQFLGGLKGGSYEFEVNGNVLEAKLYDTGIREVMDKVTQDKASMLYHSDQVFQNAQYLYSTPDYDGDPNVYRWNYFYTPVRIGDQTVGVRIAVRDMVPSADGKMDSQIYNWGIKTGATLDGGGPGEKPNTTGVSSVAPQDAALGTSASSAASSAPIIADTSAKGNTQYAQNSGGQAFDDGVGAANAGFAGDYNRLQNQSERFHPEGEKAARPVDVPVEDFQGRSIPKSAATVLEAGATPDSAVEVIEQAIANGEFSFDRITDEAAQKRARQTVESKGWDAARESFHQQAAGGKAGKHTMALGQLLLNNAMNAGDSRAVIDILTDYATLSTQSAQAMQAQRMLKKLSPEGQLYGIQRSVENLRGELAERYGDKAPDLNIDEALVDQFLQAQGQAGRDAAMEKIYRDIARQVPATWMDKWNAWRYLAMLGNPRTHVRNIVGNAAFAPVRMVKNAIGTALESGVDYLSPNGIQRTKAALNPASAEDRALVQAAFADLANVQEQLLGGGKYSESAMGKIDRYRTIFRTLPLEAVRKANSAAMDVEDTWFSRPAYAGALAGYLKANGITAQALSDGAVDASALDAARAYAVREAQRATYRDSNAFSDFVSGLRYRGKNPVGQAANVVMEGVLPFRKTPANILMRGVEYSPAGLAKGLSYDLAKVHSGEMTAAQAIDNISAGLTGTGLLALGAWLASIGLVSGGGSGDDEQDVMSDLTGGQDYALTVGDRNFTLDWLAPEALPFFVGVELWNAMTDRGADGVQFKDALSAMERITDPMLEMSMLQGLQDAIDNVRYADGGTLPKVVANAAVSYLSQGVPTLFGQLERTSEYRRDTTFVDRASWMPNDMQYTLGRVMNKLPGEFQQIPYVDAWGRQESTGNPAEQSFNNFLNPAYTSRENATEADKEIQRLLRAGQSGVVPKRTPQSVEVTYKENPKDAENQKRYLNAEEYVSYATVKGQTSYDLAMDMINSDEYRSMTDEQKAEALKLAYAYAGHVAAEEVTDGKHESEAYVALAQAAKKELGLSEAEYLLLYEQYRGELNKDKVREAYRQGMDPETYLEYASGKSSYNSDGEGGLTIAETAKSIRESGLTKDQQELLWLVSYPEWSEKADKAGVPISDYIAYKAATAGLKKSAEKKAALIDAGLPTSLYDKIG